MAYISPDQHGIADYKSWTQVPSGLVIPQDASVSPDILPWQDLTFAKLVYVVGDVSSSSTPATGLIVKAYPPLAQYVKVSGSYTYVGEAEVGTTLATAAWRCKRIYDATTTIQVTWADGNANFDNVATNLETLSYT